jgi:hypothetical protein
MQKLLMNTAASHDALLAESQLMSRAETSGAKEHSNDE